VNTDKSLSELLDGPLKRKPLKFHTFIASSNIDLILKILSLAHLAYLKRSTTF